MGRTSSLLVLAIPFVASISGCNPYPGLVKERFDVEGQCPDDRTTVAERSDTRPLCAAAPAGSAGPPSTCTGWTVYEASGCGRTVLYECHETHGRNWCTSRFERESPSFHSP
jgi:hypothetical protein